MAWCTVWLFIAAVLGIGGWAQAYLYRRRAMRFRAAFERAFAIARRVYNFSDEETNDLVRIIGEPLEQRRPDDASPT